MIRPTRTHADKDSVFTEHPTTVSRQMNAQILEVITFPLGGKRGHEERLSTCRKHLFKYSGMFEAEKSSG